MTAEQNEAGQMFAAALDVGIEEDSLIESFDSLTAKEFLDALSPEKRDALMSSICQRKGLKI